MVYKSIYLTYAGFVLQFLAMNYCAGKRLQALQYLRCITTASVNHKYRGFLQEISIDVWQLVAATSTAESQVAKLDYPWLCARLRDKIDNKRGVYLDYTRS